VAGRQTKFHLSFQPLDLLVVSIILSVSVFGRFYLLASKLIFSPDQGRALLAARNILQGHFTWLGPETSISGFHLGPFYYYLSAIPLWFTRYDPLGPAAMTALFGVATVLLLYWYGKHYWGHASGIVIALAYALSPHAIWQSRIAIEPAPLPFFAILWLILTTAWLQKNDARWLMASVFVSLLAIQLNFSAIALLLATVAFWGWQNFPSRWFAWRRRVLILVLSIILGLIIGHGLARDITSASYFWRIWQQLTFPGMSLVSLFWLVLFELTAWNFFVNWKRKTLKYPETVLSVWFLLSMAGFLTKYVSGEHSLALLFPLPAIILGLSLTKLQIFSRNMYLWASIPMILLLMGFQSLRFLEAQQPVTVFDHRQVVKEVIELAQNEPYELIYRGHLDVYEAADDHYQYLLWQMGQPPVKASRIDAQPQHAEKWLVFSSVAPVRRIYLYSSLREAQRYHDAGPFVTVGQTLLRSKTIEQ